MAIRFRCPHCRQLLGISAAQSGQVVDCPTCGRALRVPAQSGKAKPAADQPKIDVQDQELNAALDELVALSDDAPPVIQQPQHHPAPAHPPAPTVHSHRPVQPQITLHEQQPPRSQPAPVNSPIAHARPVEPIVMAPLPPAEIVSANPLSVPVHSEQAVTNYSDELHALARQQTVDSAFNSADISAFDPPDRRIAMVPVFVALLLGATGGYFGRMWETESLKPQTYENQKQDFDLDLTDQQTNRPPESRLEAAAGQVAIRGQVTYTARSGEVRPDGGARVVVFPADRVPVQKISGRGIRAADDPADQKRIVEEIREQGGSLVGVEDDGTFQIRLTNPGDYYALVISHYQPRSWVEIPAADNKVIDPWFTQGSGVLGKVAYSLQRITFAGDMPEQHNVSFDRE